MRKRHGTDGEMVPTFKTYTYPLNQIKNEFRLKFVTKHFTKLGTKSLCETYDFVVRLNNRSRVGSSQTGDARKTGQIPRGKIKKYCDSNNTYPQFKNLCKYSAVDGRISVYAPSGRIRFETNDKPV